MSRPLIVRISDALDCPLKDADKILKAVSLCIKDEVVQTGKLNLIGLGTFSVKRLMRTSRLNKIDYKIDKNYIKFKASRKFTSMVRED